MLFALSIILIIKSLFKDQFFLLFENTYVFIVALILPPIVTYYLPYADALYTLLFALALWGLVKNKYWWFFIFIMFFSMTRPVFFIVGVSLFILELYYLIKHRKFLHFIMELLLKLYPLLIGVFIVFFMFYLNSGSFFKYFEVNDKYWNMAFSFPSKISDWSMEGLGMNVFTIFFILIPSLIVLVNNFIKLIRSEKYKELPTVFNGNLSFIKDYFFNLSIIYFWGVFLYVIFYQKGSLNGLSRYIFVSPFFYIYFFIGIQKLKNINKYTFLIFTTCFLVVSILMLTSLPDMKHSLNFNDSGFFTLFLDLIFLYSMRYMKNSWKIVSLSIIGLYNIVWITYLYNIYLCNGWIFT